VKDHDARMNQLSSTDLDERAAAVAGLGWSRRPEAIQPLVSLLDDPVVGRDAARALGKHGGAGAAEALRAAWDRRVGGDHAARIAEALARKAMLPLRGIVDLGEALAHLGDPVAAAALIDLGGLGRDPEVSGAWAVRLAAVQALAWLPQPEVAHALVTAHDDPEDEVAEAAAGSLASFGTVACVPYWLERFEGQSRLSRGIEQGIYELFGDDAPPQGAAHSELRRWWMRAADEIPAERCTWMGQPASPELAIERLDGDDGNLARFALERWIGIDFVEDPDPNATADDDEVTQARAWWAQHQAGWEAGALYRGGRKLALAPLVAALASPRS
jgi:HEAT repeat protein